MRLYATFKGVSHLEKDDKFPNKMQLDWEMVTDDSITPLKGIFTCNKTKAFEKIVLRRGNRYILECKELKDNKIVSVDAIRATLKNKKCSLIRTVAGIPRFISGKYSGKQFHEIDSNELNGYLIWLAKNTANEATVENSIKILKLLQ